MVGRTHLPITQASPCPQQRLSVASKPLPVPVLSPFQSQLGVPSYPLGERTSESLVEEQGLSFRSLCGLESVTSLLFASPFSFCNMGVMVTA